MWNDFGYCSQLSCSIPNNDGVIDQAISFINSLIGEGGTNINTALLKALEIAKRVKYQEDIDSKTEQMIVFLTDGHNSNGFGNNDMIKENVRRANKGIHLLLSLTLIAKS